jgi:large subunit ribosomal protein L21
MVAVVRIQGFQFRVEPDQVVQVPRLQAEAGESLTLDEVLFVESDGVAKVGRPVVPGAVVTARVVGHDRGEKVTAGKYKRRKKYRRRWGFRRETTEIRIGDIRI